MSRVQVWFDAYEKFAIEKGFATYEITSKMSNDELSDYVFSIVKANNVKEEFDEFVHKYCMQYK